MNITRVASVTENCEYHICEYMPTYKFQNGRRDFDRYVETADYVTTFADYIARIIECEQTGASYEVSAIGDTHVLDVFLH